MRWIHRLLTVAVAVVLLWGGAGPTPAGAATPAALGPGRFLASPLGRVTWINVSPDRLLLGDESTGVAALNPVSGSVLWTHASTRGAIRGIWSVGSHVVVAAGSLEVLNGKTGEVLWRHDLRCGAPGRCMESAHWAGPEGIAVAGRGQRHTSLRLLDLFSGRPIWGRAVSVAHPDQVRVRGATMLAVDGEEPYGIHIIDRASGVQKSPFSWPEMGRPVGLGFTPDGPAWAFYPGDDRMLGAVAVLSEQGRVMAQRELRQRGGLTGPVRWTHLSGDHLWLWGGHKAPLGAWLHHHAMGTSRDREVIEGVVVDRPLVVADVLLLHRHDGKALDLSGFQPSSGRLLWSHRLDAPLRQGAWHEVDRLGLLVLGGQPAPLLLVAPRDGTVVAVGELDAPGQEVVGAGRLGTTLFVAVREGVFAHPVIPLKQLRHSVTSALRERRFQDATALFHPLALAADMSPEVLELAERLVRDTVLETRLNAGSRETGGLEVFVAGLSGLDRGGGRALGIWAKHLARAVGDVVLAPRRLRSLSVTVLVERLALQLTGALDRVGDSIQEGRGARQSWSALRDSLLVMGAALMRVDRGAEAARVVDAALAWSPEHIPGLAQLHQALSVRGVEQVLEELGPSLVDHRSGVRAEALEALGDGPLLKAALPNEEILIGLVEQGSISGLSSSDVTDLRDRLADALEGVHDTLGDGLGEPGCLLVCDALERTCGSGCRTEAGCTRAGTACRKSCTRTGLRWKPPRAFPRSEREARRCY